MHTKLQSNYTLFEFVIISLFFICIAACTRKERMSPPTAKIIVKTDTLHGEIVVDNYYWLRDRDNPEMIEYLEAENKYTMTMMKHTEKFQENLYEELLSRIKETDLDVPVKIDDFYYYRRTEEGKQYSIYCRKKGSLDAEEEILLDQNALAEGKKYFRTGVYKVSPNHQLLAYSTDTTGAETYTIYIKDLNTGKLLGDELPNTYYAVEWANDNKTLFYNVLDDAKRPYKLFKHTLGTGPEQDQLIHFEEDEAYHLWLSKTRSKQYLLLRLRSTTTTEVWYQDANRPNANFKLIHPRQHEMEYSVDHHSDKFFIWTNDKARNFRLMETSVKNPSKKNWKEILPHRENVKIDNVHAFKNHLVLYERENGLKKIRITKLNSQDVHYVEFPEPVYTYWSSRNPDFNTEMLRFSYTSLVTPSSVFDYNMNTKDRELKKQYEVLGGYEPANYESERIFAEAPDGTKVPISIVYKKGLAQNGHNPCFLYGYGSYGASMDPNFSSNRLTLLDRGFVFALAHIRGGGEMGRYWYDQGKLLNKKNTFADFIACAEKLVADKYTSPDKLVIGGGSAGGLLMGTVTNMRPDLFKVVVARFRL